MKTGTAIGIITLAIHRVYLISKGIYLGFNSEDRIKKFVTEPWKGEAQSNTIFLRDLL